jgi:GT2 family glycosyltransferase
MISVILVQYNNGALTLDAVRTLRGHSRSPHEIIVVDNASTDNSLLLLRKNLQDITVVENGENLGFGAANDLASRQARGEILLFLNNDTLCQGDILTPAEDAFAGDGTVGVLGPALTHPDGSFQLSGVASFVLERGRRKSTVRVFARQPSGCGTPCPIVLPFKADGWLGKRGGPVHTQGPFRTDGPL